MQDYFTFQWISLYLFVIILTFLVIKHKKKMEFQKMLFPVLYAGIWKTGFGLKQVNKWGSKYGAWFRFFGYISVGVGFVGMVVIFYQLAKVALDVFINPAAQAGVGLILPQTNVPGIGFLPFWYWIIAILVIVIIHEFAHALVAKAHGIPIKSSGLGFFAIIAPIIPIAFVEPDEKKVEKQSDIVQYSIYAAGPGSNLLTFAAIFFLLLPLLMPMASLLGTPGGFTFTASNTTVPAAIVPEDFTVTVVNGNDVDTWNDFANEIGSVSPGDQLTLANAQEEYTLTAIASDTNENIGIYGMHLSKNLLNAKHSQLALDTFNWTVGLLFWIGLLSFGIGLFNLVPLGPIDGGRMLRVFMHSVYEDKKKADSHWGKISLVMLVLILITLAPIFF